MPKNLSQLTEEATKELIRRLDQHSRVNNIAIGCQAALAHDLLPLLTTAITEAWKEASEQTLEHFRQIEKEKWNNAEHCSCLGYAIHMYVHPDDKACQRECMGEALFKAQEESRE